MSAVAHSGTTVTTVVVEEPALIPYTLHLKKRKKRVVWTEDVVDNELLNKKKSKKCCIFHKQRNFDESSSDESDSDDSHSEESKEAGPHSHFQQPAAEHGEHCSCDADAAAPSKAANVDIPSSSPCDPAPEAQ